MASGNSRIDRSEAEALLQTQDINEIVEDAQRTSVALSSFRRVNMGSGTARMPVLSALPTAGFVTEATGSAGSKPTSEVAWNNKELVAEEIAVIVPIHENVFDDSTFNIWEEVRPLISQEFARVLDGAVLFGTNIPSTWAAALEPGARTAGNVFVAGSNDSNTPPGDLAEDINQTYALVESDGYDVNVQYAARSLRARLRGLRDANRQPIYLDGLRSDGASGSIYGQDLMYVTNGAWVPAQDPDGTNGSGDEVGATLIAGDRSKAILGVRQDVTYKLLDQATVGGFNLAERDMIALRAKMRIAFQTAAPVNPENGGSGHPFAILAV